MYIYIDIYIDRYVHIYIYAYRYIMLYCHATMFRTRLCSRNLRLEYLIYSIQSYFQNNFGKTVKYFMSDYFIYLESWGDMQFGEDIYKRDLFFSTG